MIAERINKLTYDDIDKISATKVRSEVQKMLSIDVDDEESTPK